MWPQETKPECCIDPEPLPSNTKCMTQDICNELAYLYNRHRRTFIKNKRIMEMARVKRTRSVQRFVAKCPCYFKKHIQIIHLEQRQQTRTEQLAFPKARQLFLFKEEVKGLFPPERLLNLNRLIRKSLFSIYSRLANIKPPMERIPIPKWDKKEWADHKKKLSKLARPKVPKKPPKLPVKSMPLKQMRRYKYLARPKKDTLIEKPMWILTMEMRKYKASKRIRDLARPIVRDTSMLYTELPIQIPVHVLKAKASKRIGELAEPSARRTAQSATSDLKENPFMVSPNALKTKASKRTAELAEPKEYENKHIREDPYAISKAALNCKAKPRTCELAKPRKR
ncbi:hypothetical protein DOY81_001455 [Sarcophaga bullata]|nr:hypothetical protein DOY81_001455 [Sarcophaga bullata]